MRRKLVAALVLAVAFSITIVASTDVSAAVESELSPLTVSELTPPFPIGSSTVTAIDLDNADRALVNIDNGQTNTGYIVADGSWTRAADFRPTAFSTIGSLVRRNVVVGNRGTDAQSQASISVDTFEQAIAQRLDANFSTIVNDVNRSGTVVGQFSKGNFWQAFSIKPTDEDKDGIPETWFKDDDPQDNINDLFSDLGATRPGASIATAVNDDGTVVGIYTDEQGIWQSFGVSGGPGARPNDIANIGTAAGLNMTTQRALLFPSTVLDPNGNFGNTSAVSINSHEQIVGTSTDRAGFYYDSANGLVTLNDRIPNATDRRSYSPTKINDSGLITANASNHAFLLSPQVSCQLQAVAGAVTAIASADCPTVWFTWKVRAGGGVELSANAAGGTGGYRYEWQFSDGASESTTEPLTSHYFDIMKPERLTGNPAEMEQTATLEIIDSSGNRSDPVTHTISMCNPDLRPRNGQEFSGLVRCMEHFFPRLNMVQMLSMMRKYYYGSESWSISRSKFWDSAIIRCGIQVPNPNPVIPTGLRMRLNEEGSYLTSVNINGSMGHVFTGLDAFRCYRSSMRPLTRPENVTFATWLGDLASAVEQKVFADKETGTVGPWSDHFGERLGGAKLWNLVADRDAIVLQQALASDTACKLSNADLAKSAISTSTTLGPLLFKTPI